MKKNIRKQLFHKCYGAQRKGTDTIKLWNCFTVSVMGKPRPCVEWADGLPSPVCVWDDFF